MIRFGEGIGQTCCQLPLSIESVAVLSFCIIYNLNFVYQMTDRYFPAPEFQRFILQQPSCNKLTESCLINGSILQWHE